MPVARIITAAREHLEELSAELRQAGYTVEFAAPGDAEAGADLVINAELVNSEDAMTAAERAATQMKADVVVAPGSVASDSQREQRRQQEELERQHLAAAAREREERAQREAEERRREQEAAERQRLLAETRAREEREHREAEERRREQEAAEQQRLVAEARARVERERREAEERRREQEAAEQQRLVAEARARVERERREAERIRVERERRAREREEALVRTLQTPVDSAAEPAFAAARIAEVRSEPAPLPRHSPRQRQLQRAMLAASIVALIVMLGFAVSLRLKPEPPLPASVVQNPVQQEVPFGPAHITPKPPAAAPVPAQKKKPRVNPRAKRASRDNAGDEVVVHQLSPARRQTTAQSRTNDGVRRYSDQ